MSTVELHDMCVCGHPYGDHSAATGKCLHGRAIHFDLPPHCDAGCAGFKLAKKARGER